MRPKAALTRLNYSTLSQTLSNSTILAESKHQIMQRAVSNCPSVTLQLLGIELISLLDSGSMVTLIREGSFMKYILPKLQNSQELSQAHSLFRLSAVNNGIMPVSHYFEADVNLLGFTVPRVGFLVIKDPNFLLTPPYTTQLPGVVGCNLIQLGCEEFGRVHGFHHFDRFTCPETVHPVVFSQLYTFYHQGKLQGNSTNMDMTNIKTESVRVDSSYSPIPQNLEKETNLEQESQADNVLGQVWVSEYHQSICVPANSVKILTGRMNKIQKKYSCLIEPREINNLPLGVVVNRTIITPKKSKHVLIILMNTNSYNIWIRQPLLAANVVGAEYCPWDHTTNMTQDGEEIKISCHQIPTAEVQEEIPSSIIQQQDVNLKHQIQTQSEKNESKTHKEKPKFGPPPDFDSSS